MVPNRNPRHSGYVSSGERTNRSHTQGEMKMKKLFVSSLLTAMAVPVMFAQATPAPDTKPTTTTKSTTKAKKTALQEDHRCSGFGVQHQDGFACCS